MAQSSIRFSSYPRTSSSPPFIAEIVRVFRKCEPDIATLNRQNRLKSDDVLRAARTPLLDLGFEVEMGKKRTEKIHRPVFFGENGIPVVRYEIDAYHQNWQCGLEIEAGRAWLGNAVYRDIVLGALMVDVSHLIIAVPNEYWSKSSGRDVVSRDYDYASRLAETIYAHERLVLPYRLTILGY